LPKSNIKKYAKILLIKTVYVMMWYAKMKGCKQAKSVSVWSPMSDNFRLNEKVFKKNFEKGVRAYA
jgi:hypothetical protein